MGGMRLFLLQLGSAVLEIVDMERLHVCSRNNQGRVVEEIVHFLERNLGSLWQEEIEEESVREVANLVLVSHGGFPTPEITENLR